MKNSKLKKLVALTMGTAVTVSTLAGCGAAPAASTASSQPATSTQAVATGENSADPFAEKVELTIAVRSTPNVENWDDNWQTKLLEEKYNVELKFVLLPTDTEEAKTKLSLMVASGETLPDVINTGIGATSLAPVSDYGSKGVFVDLTSYYNDPNKMPNWNKLPQADRDFILANMTSPDGKVYCFPGYEENQWNEGCYRAWINLDFMQAAGIETAPTTTDEFYEMLKAFASTDCNGNGKADEIAMTGATGWAQDPIPYLMNSFLYANPDKSYFDVQDGKVIASFVQPEWKEGLTYINKLVSEGLLSPLSFTQDMTQAKALINVEKGMAGVVTSGSYSIFDKKVVGDPGFGHGYALLAPVKGPEGKIYTPQNPSVPQCWWEITKDCKNVDRAVAIGDYFLTEEASKCSQFGEPDVDWSEDPAVVAKYAVSKYVTDAGWKTSFAIINKIWNVPQSKTWQEQRPKYRIIDEKNNMAADVLADTEEGKAIAAGGYSSSVDYVASYSPVFRPREELITNFRYTEDETNELADIQTTIDTYVKEQTVAFVTGKRSLDDWDKYLSELDKMGLQRYIEINQAAYDRL